MSVISRQIKATEERRVTAVRTAANKQTNTNTNTIHTLARVQHTNTYRLGMRAHTVNTHTDVDIQTYTLL